MTEEDDVLVVSRYRPPAGTLPDVEGLAAQVLAALADRAGFRSGWCGRSTEDASLWLLVTEWESVGTYRRALSSYDVRVALAPLMHLAVDEPAVFEVLVRQSPEGVARFGSDLAADSL
ncbi:MAG: antibiotic biosynthesis monooxygenase family protein [Actinomycetes bacterium]